MTDSMLDDSYRSAFIAASKLRDLRFAVQYWNDDWTVIDFSTKSTHHFNDEELIAFAREKGWGGEG